MAVRLERNFKYKSTFVKVAGGTTPCYPKKNKHRPGFFFFSPAAATTNKRLKDMYLVLYNKLIHTDERGLCVVTIIYKEKRMNK